MKKIFYALCLFVMMSLPSRAQMPYLTSVQQQAYQPLSGGTSLNGGQVWWGETLSVPLGFNFKMQGTTISRFNLAFNMVATDTAGTISGFVLTGSDFYDRGHASGSASRSPLRYQLSGNPGSRIFKFEIANAGFADEKAVYGTDLDSFHMQVWLYEGSNVVEYRFGPSRVSHFNDYFTNSGLQLGYARNVNFLNASLDVLYMLHGNPASPGLDSMKTSQPGSGLSAFPANGTVYRFTPKSNGSTSVAAALPLQEVRVYPTICRDLLQVQQSGRLAESYRLLHMTGGLAQEGRLQDGFNVLDLSALPAGMYLLQLQGPDGVATHKIVKQ